MKRFLKNSILFAFLLGGIIILLQLIISIRIKGKTVTGFDTLELTSDVNANLVFMGSSRCWAHFDPKFFEKNFHLKSVNIGMNGHSDLMAATLRLENYLNRNKAPKFVILNIDPFIFAGSLENNTKFINKNDYARFAFLPNKVDEPLLKYFKFTYAEKYIPLYALFKYQLFLDCVTLKKSNSFPEGFELNDEKWDTIKYPKTDAAKKNFFKSKEAILITNSLENLNNFCKKKNIKLICVQTPVYQTAYDETAFKNPKNICGKLIIPYINVNEEYIRNNTNYFYNTIHLNKNGVYEMNKIFRNDKELTAILK